MKCNTVECLLKKQTKNGVANGIIRTIKIRGNGENGAALAIEGFDYTDCISVGSVQVNNFTRTEAQSSAAWSILARYRAAFHFKETTAFLSNRSECAFARIHNKQALLSLLDARTNRWLAETSPEIASCSISRKHLCMDIFKVPKEGEALEVFAAP